MRAVYLRGIEMLLESDYTDEEISEASTVSISKIKLLRKDLTKINNSSYGTLVDLEHAYRVLLGNKTD
ncbi:hypothetical protein [Macrococcus armenti]|uniref:hypothetical protein n=1 Tax=Macrococcus armenti TaxID=2875764 RepID=UPI001CCAA259|nr:hypothetical protein [Macrococcus armenti]UBH08860.1 hypothetical protein LAU41_01400 [Macrococcus armenti]UBH08869.1 hypothetical protein LAU41_01450 [Macrococcus armenti]UBH11158.1 hypothetical protein LAU38_01400 [Macrococcus armenti]